MTVRTVLLVVEYDGAAFLGWQRQAGGRTVQEVLERAVEGATGEKRTVHAAGRTDAGVHAAGQCAHLRTGSRLPDDRLRDALNAHLPPDVAVREVRAVSETFHARFDAVTKRYLYRIVVRRSRPVLDRGRALWLKEPPDLGRMREAARALAGRHDFRAFSASTRGGRDTVRRLRTIRVRRTREGFFLVLEAEGFLPRMARSIVGTLLEVGRGSLAPESVGAILRRGDRAGAGPTAPAEGLYLLRVRYGRGAREGGVDERREDPQKGGVSPTLHAKRVCRDSSRRATGSSRPRGAPLRAARTYPPPAQRGGAAACPWAGLPLAQPPAELVRAPLRARGPDLPAGSRGRGLRLRRPRERPSPGGNDREM